MRGEDDLRAQMDGDFRLMTMRKSPPYGCRLTSQKLKFAVLRPRATPLVALITASDP